MRDRGIIDLVTNYSIGDFHPPLYHILLKAWLYLPPINEFTARLPSIFFGLVTIWATFQISKLVFNSQKIQLLPTWHLPIAMIPPTLLTISSLHLHYSAEARMYSLAAMGTTLSLLFILKKISHRKKLFPNTSFALFSKLPGIAWLKAKSSRGERNKSAKLVPKSSPNFLKQDFKQSKKLSVFIITSLLVLLLSDYVPWLLLPLFFLVIPIETAIALIISSWWWPLFFKQLQTGLSTASQFPGWGAVVGGFSVKNILLIPVKFLIGRFSIDNNLLYALFLLPSLLICLITVFYLSRRLLSQKLSKRIQFLTLSFFIPLVFGVLLSFKISLLSYFRFLYLLPVFYLLLTYGISRFQPKIQILSLTILFFTTTTSSFIYLFFPAYHRENWRGFSSWVDSQQPISAITLIPNLAQADPYLYYQKNIPIYDDLKQVEKYPDVIFLVRYVQEIFDPQDQLKTQLESLGYIFESQTNFNGVVVWKYVNSHQLFAKN